MRASKIFLHAGSFSKITSMASGQRVLRRGVLLGAGIETPGGNSGRVDKSASLLCPCSSCPVPSVFRMLPRSSEIARDFCDIPVSFPWLGSAISKNAPLRSVGQEILLVKGSDGDPNILLFLPFIP